MVLPALYGVVLVLVMDVYLASPSATTTIIITIYPTTDRYRLPQPLPVIATVTNVSIIVAAITICGHCHHHGCHQYHHAYQLYRCCGRCYL